MPIVDGLTSAKMIRSHEAVSPRDILSPRAALNGRVPIFAVSASLVERDREVYVNAGFDGWILKPVDFRRLAELMEGIVLNETRDRCLYVPGEWEVGGWFAQREGKDGLDRASTWPLLRSSVDSGNSRKEDNDDMQHGCNALGQRTLASEGSSAETITPTIRSDDSQRTETGRVSRSRSREREMLGAGRRAYSRDGKGKDKPLIIDDRLRKTREEGRGDSEMVGERVEEL